MQAGHSVYKRHALVGGLRPQAPDYQSKALWLWGLSGIIHDKKTHKKREPRIFRTICIANRCGYVDSFSFVSCRILAKLHLCFFSQGIGISLDTTSHDDVILPLVPGQKQSRNAFIAASLSLFISGFAWLSGTCRVAPASNGVSFKQSTTAFRTVVSIFCNRSAS